MWSLLLRSQSSDFRVVVGVGGVMEDFPHVFCCSRRISQVYVRWYQDGLIRFVL